MKRIVSLMAAAAVLLAGAVSCRVISEDAFSTDPVGPQLYDHNDILITANTMDEDVNFSWKPYRNLPEGLTYTLYMSSDGQEAQVFSSATDLYWKLTKQEFKDLLYRTFPDLPVNDTFPLSFRLSIESGGKTYSSEQSLKVYAYGDAIAPIAVADAPEIVLDPADPEASIDIASWNPARLVYGETVLYDVYVVVNGEEVKIAEGLSGTSASVKADDLNEAIVGAGGTEDAANEVTFKVVAYCESLPEGIATVTDPVSVTTYLTTFPEVLYVPGSHQDWNPATAPTIPLSTVKKGFYQGIVDLTTRDGSDAKFKFSPNPAWDGDFGGTVEVNPNGSGEYPSASGTVGVPDDIVVPSGVYYIEVDMKQNILRMVQFGSLSLIGSAVGDFDWKQDVDLAYDAEAKTFSVVTPFKAGKFKMRFNHNWDCSIGGSAETGFDLTGSDIETGKEGEYRFIVDASVAPFNIRFINMSFPEKLYIPGSHNDWKPAANYLEGNGEGRYEGFVSVGGEWGFKFTPTPDSFDGEIGFVEGFVPTEVLNDQGNPTGFLSYQLTDSNAGNIIPGSEVAYRKLIVDLSEMTVQIASVTGVGIIGGFDGNSWSTDQYPLTYDAGTDSWKATGVELSKNIEWKFRMNGDWSINLGGELGNLTQDGGNLKLAESGVYDVELFIGTTPYRAVLTKTGGSSEPEYPENMYMIGLAFGGWTWESDSVVELTPVNSQPGQFWTIRYIEANSPFKFCAKRAWSGDFNHLGENTGFTISGGDCLVDESGVYMILVDTAHDRLAVERARVYGIGPAFGGWNEGMAGALFTESGGQLTGTVPADGELRMYAASAAATSDWWTREFVILDGRIVCRGTGGELAKVPVKAGDQVTLDFNAGTGAISSEGGEGGAVEIKIDGDMSEWAGIEGASADGINAAFKVASDETNLYFYVKRSAERMAEVWEGGAYHYYTFDLDGNPDNGETLWGNGPYDLILVVYPYAGSASSPAFGIAKAGAAAPGTCTVANAVIQGVVTESGVETEIAIPRSDLLAMPSTPVTVYSWSNKGGGDKLSVTTTL